MEIILNKKNFTIKNKYILLTMMIFVSIILIQVKNQEDIPVLMYHSIGEGKNFMTVSPKNFDEQMNYLKINGYNTITMDELYNHMVNKLPLPNKSILITFDDGYVDNYIYAYPILKKYNFKATVFIITDYIDITNKSNSYYLTLNQLKDMQGNNIDIESHTVHHVKLSHLSDVQQFEELSNSKKILEGFLNKKVNYIAYPFGNYNKDTLKIAEKVGYNMGFVTITPSSKFAQNYKIKRIYVSPNTSKLGLYLKIKSYKIFP